VRRLGLPLLAGMALIGLETSAVAAEPLPLDLDWQAPAECANSEQIRAELARIAHVRPGRVVQRLSARGRIEKTGGNYRLALKTERNGEVGERGLVAAECRSLEREVTLVLAVAFGEGVEIVEPPPEDEPQGPPAETTKAPPEPEKPATKPPEPPRPVITPPPPEKPHEHARDAPSAFRAAFFAGGGGALRVLPSLAGFAVGGAELGTARYWIEPRLTWLPRVQGELPRDVRARYSGVSGALAGCIGVPAASLRAGACLGAEASALFGHSTGATESDDATAPLYTANAALSLAWPRRAPLSVRLDAALRVALNEPRFVVEGLGEAYRVPRLLPSFGAVLMWAPIR
jgi:hypothetical protein